MTAIFSSTRRVLGLTLLTFVAGCINRPIQERTASRYYEAGVAAARAGEWRRADELLRRALLNAEQSNAGDEATGHVHYELGLVSGVLCNFEEAARHLQRALELHDELAPPALGELARLHFDQRRYAEAVTFWERVFPRWEQLGAARVDPVGFALVLEEYAIALGALGRTADAAAVSERAARLRLEHPSSPAGVERIPYGTRCEPEGGR